MIKFIDISLHSVMRLNMKYLNWGEIEVYVISFNNWFGLIWSLPWELESLTRPDLRYPLLQWLLGLWRRNTVFLQ